MLLDLREMTNIVSFVLLMLVVFMSGGCAKSDNNLAPVDFEVILHYKKDLIPENVILEIKNLSKDFICVPIAETSLIGGRIMAYPEVDDEHGNRPPSKILSGLDITEGLYVIEKGQSMDIFINIVNNRPSAAEEIKGEVRAVSCKDLFKSVTVPISRRTFHSNLR